MRRSLKMILSVLFAALLLVSSVYTLVPLGRAIETDSHIPGKTGAGLVNFAMKAYTENWGYVYGASGEVLTIELVDKLAGWYPDNFNATNSDGTTYYELCLAKVGRRGADCSGLIRAYLWWAGDDTNPAYDWSVGALTSNAMFEEASVKGEIGSLPDVPGVLLYKPGHVGIYAGGGMAVDLRGTEYDMRYGPVKSLGWTHWYYSPYLDYSGEDADPNVYTANSGYYDTWQDMPETVYQFPENYGEYAQTLSPVSTLRLGAKSFEVAVMQNRLSELGYFYGEPDGQFGYGTEEALIRFQEDSEMNVTGSGDIETLDLLYSAYAEDVAQENSISLFLGKIDENVPTVQNRLKKLGYYDSSIGDVFDEKTEQAVVEFQTDAQLNANGKCTNSVIDVLFSEDAPVREDTVDIMELPAVFEDHNFANPICTGTEGSTVAAIQAKLRELSYYNGSVDGVFTKETEQSVQKFQNDTDLAPNGIATKETLSTLFSENVNAQPTVTKPETVEINGAIKPGEVLSTADKTIQFPVSLTVTLIVLFLAVAGTVFLLFWQTKSQTHQNRINNKEPH